LNSVAEKSMLYIAQVLTSSPTAANPALLAHNFRDQSIDISGAGQEMTVATVIANHIITLLKPRCDGDADPLLTDTSVDSSKKLSLGKQAEKLLLDHPN
jgi:hypothetical protein